MNASPIFDFAGKRVLVTGGTSGIGLAIGRAFAEAGAEVLVTGLAAEEVDRYEPLGRSISAVRLDVTDGVEIGRLAAGQTRLDALINCAGTIRRGGAEHDPAEFARVVEVNLVGAMRVSAACRELLFASQGSVVNIASMLSLFGSGFVPGYSASKGGLVQLTKSLAIAWGAAGVRVNAVAPGWIETPLTEPLTADPARRQAIVDRTPLGRWGRPGDVCGAVLFLCSPAAGFITGAMLTVDGGYSVS